MGKSEVFSLHIAGGATTSSPMSQPADSSPTAPPHKVSGSISDRMMRMAHSGAKFSSFTPNSSSAFQPPKPTATSLHNAGTSHPFTPAASKPQESPVAEPPTPSARDPAPKAPSASPKQQQDQPSHPIQKSSPGAPLNPQQTQVPARADEHSPSASKPAPQKGAERVQKQNQDHSASKASAKPKTTHTEPATVPATKTPSESAQVAQSTQSQSTKPDSGRRAETKVSTQREKQNEAPREPKKERPATPKTAQTEPKSRGAAAERREQGAQKEEPKAEAKSQQAQTDGRILGLLSLKAESKPAPQEHRAGQGKRDGKGRQKGKGNMNRVARPPPPEYPPLEPIQQEPPTTADAPQYKDGLFPFWVVLSMESLYAEEPTNWAAINRILLDGGNSTGFVDQASMQRSHDSKMKQRERRERMITFGQSIDQNDRVATTIPELRSEINKISPSNVDEMCDVILKIILKTLTDPYFTDESNRQRMIREFIYEVGRKALLEPMYCRVYARFIRLFRQRISQNSICEKINIHSRANSNDCGQFVKYCCRQFVQVLHTKSEGYESFVPSGVMPNEKDDAEMAEYKQFLRDSYFAAVPRFAGELLRFELVTPQFFLIYFVFNLLFSSHYVAAGKEELCPPLTRDEVFPVQSGSSSVSATPTASVAATPACSAGRERILEMHLPAQDSGIPIIYPNIEAVTDVFVQNGQFVLEAIDKLQARDIYSHILDEFKAFTKNKAHPPRYRFMVQDVLDASVKNYTDVLVTERLQSADNSSRQTPQARSRQTSARSSRSTTPQRTQRRRLLAFGRQTTEAPATRVVQQSTRFHGLEDTADPVDTNIIPIIEAAVKSSFVNAIVNGNVISDSPVSDFEAELRKQWTAKTELPQVQANSLVRFSEDDEAVAVPRALIERIVSDNHIEDIGTYTQSMGGAFEKMMSPSGFAGIQVQGHLILRGLAEALSKYIDDKGEITEPKAAVLQVYSVTIERLVLSSNPVMLISALTACTSFSSSFSASFKGTQAAYELTWAALERLGATEVAELLKGSVGSLDSVLSGGRKNVLTQFREKGFQSCMAPLLQNDIKTIFKTSFGNLLQARKSDSLDAELETLLDNVTGKLQEAMPDKEVQSNKQVRVTVLRAFFTELFTIQSSVVMKRVTSLFASDQDETASLFKGLEPLTIIQATVYGWDQSSSQQQTNGLLPAAFQALLDSGVIDMTAAAKWYKPSFLRADPRPRAQLVNFMIDNGRGDVTDTVK